MTKQLERDEAGRPAPVGTAPTGSPWSRLAIGGAVAVAVALAAPWWSNAWVSPVAATATSLLAVVGAATVGYALSTRRVDDRHARATRNMLDGLWEWDLAAGLVHLSPRWRSMLGLDPEDPSDIETSFFRLLHPTDRSRVEAAVQAHFESEAPYDMEFRLRGRDGRYRWFWARGETERSEDGEPIRMSGGITEITARKEVEEALRRADRILRLRSACNLALVRARDEEELLRSVCDVAVREGGYPMAWVGYAEHDEARSVRPLAVSGREDGYLEEVSSSWDSETPSGNGPVGRCIRTGLPQAAQNLIGDVAYEPWRAAAERCGFRSSCAIPLRAAADTIGALALYSHETRAFDAEEIALLSDVGSDVSFGIRAKRDAVALDEHQAKLALFRQAIDGSTDAFFVADADTGLFVDFNESAAEQLGYTRNELLGLGPADIAPRLRDEEAWAGVVRAARRGAAGVRRSAHVRKDGSEFPVELTFSSIPDHGRTLILAIARDVSEREAAERESDTLRRQLEQAQKMESVGRLAGGVAHDFNNLLTVVNATADMALTEVAPDSPLRAELEEIRGAGERAARLTRQLLAFSRRQIMHPTRVQLNDVVGDFVEMIRRVIGEHVVLDADLADGLPLIESDSGQLEQVLMNLCVNARDAMPFGGRLTIKTERVTLGEDDAGLHVSMVPGEHVLLAVADTGHGMDEATRARVFEPFFTTKDPGKGTGLGLSTAYGIVKQSGGSIWAYSEPGLGTTFKIYFPVAEGGTPTSPSRPAPTGSETILLVEDEEAIRGLVRRILDRAGYSVVEAASGREALDILGRANGSVEMILTDLVMPGMSGTQLAARVARSHPKVRILLATGYSADALSSRLPQDRHWNIIGKPYAVEDLLHQVRHTLDR